MQSSRPAAAIHILSLLAMEPGEAMTSDWIAGSVGTHPVVVRRLLGRLRQAGLVDVQPGPKGGARLSRRAEEIRLGEVYRAVEDEGLLALPRHPNPACPVGGCIEEALAGFFGRAERALISDLDRSTLADVLSALDGIDRPSPKPDGTRNEESFPSG